MRSFVICEPKPARATIGKWPSSWKTARSLRWWRPEIRSRSPAGPEPWIGKQSFEFRLPTADGSARLEIAAQVSLPPAVVVAMHLLPKGTIVRACDVQLKRLKPGVSPGELFQTIEDVVGKEAVRNIPVGQPLDGNFVHPPLLVRTGEVVTVFGRNGGIVVRMPARARENGSEGDLVTRRIAVGSADVFGSRVGVARSGSVRRSDDHGARRHVGRRQSVATAGTT